MVKEYDSAYAALVAARRTTGAFDYDPPYPGPVDSYGDHTSAAPVHEIEYEKGRTIDKAPTQPWNVKQRGMVRTDFSK